MALYQKHRPQLFATIVDQSPIVTTLTNQLTQNKVAHAYLFCGPRGVGKTTTARVLAKAINCEKRVETEFEPCTICTSCIEISQGNAIDVIEIDAASHTGVDNVRQNIIENAQFKPTKSKFKIFIVDEVHMLSTAAFNALLKTLEEPPSYAMFILATTETHKLPATIISRCQRFNFKKVPAAAMKTHLAALAKSEGVKVDDEVLARVAKKSEGSVRDAVSLLDQLMASGNKTITAKNASVLLPTTSVESQLTFVKLLIDGDVKAGWLHLAALQNDGVSLVQFADELIELLRSLLIASVDTKLALDELDLSGALADEFTALAQRLTGRDIVALLDLTLQRAREIHVSHLPQLPLEMLLVEWAARQEKTLSVITNSTAANASVETRQRLAPATAISDSPTATPEPPKSEPPKKTITEKIKDIVVGPDIAKASVEKIWPQFSTEVERNFASLAFLLKMATLTGTTGHTIQITVAYSFHQEKLMEATCRHNLETILTNLLGQPARLEVELKTADESPVPVSAELQELASAFGGEVM